MGTPHGLTPEQRFWMKVNKDGPLIPDRPELGPCWEWTASLRDTGYGQFRFEGKSTLAHRVAWFLRFGVWPTGELDHFACYRHHCVNTDHMQDATHAENQQNRAGLQRNNTTGYPGVYRTPKGRFLVSVKSRGKNHYGGTHATAELANAAAVDLRNRLHTNNQRDRTEGTTP